MTKVENYTWGEYLEEAKAASGHSHNADSWTDFESFTSALNKMANGDDAYAAKADKFFDELSNVTEGVPMREWTPCVYGAYPVVPEYLMGAPHCMRTLSPSGDPAPVRIVISTTCSAGVGKETMTKRGVVILALLMKLQAIRPVELEILVEGAMGSYGNLFQVIRVDTKPLSIAHACFALANVGFARQLTYGVMKKKHNWHGGWPQDYRNSGYEQTVREALNLAPDDLWIRSAYMLDDMLKDPVKWVNQQLEKYAAIAAE